MAANTAAIAATVGAGVAAAAASSADLKPKGLSAAVAAAAGGLGGFLLWKWATRGPENAALDLAVEAALLRAEGAGKRAAEDINSDREHGWQVEEWLAKLPGSGGVVSPALQAAARSHATVGRLSKDARSQLEADFRTGGLDEHSASRASELLVRGDEVPLGLEDQVLADAAGLALLSKGLDPNQESGVMSPAAADKLQKAWKSMSPRAHSLAWGFTFTPRSLSCMIEIVGAAEGLEATESPVVAPRLPAQTVALLKESWDRVPKDTFGQSFFDRLYAEDPVMQKLLATPATKVENVSLFVQVLVGLLDTESVPRLERIVHCATALARKFGGLRMKHMAAIRRAFVRTATTHAKEKKKVNRAWESFFYAMAAVAAPQLVLTDSLPDLMASIAASLPTPGGGPQAGIAAAQGIGLLEMSLAVTASSQGGTPVPDEVMGRLQEARVWLLDSVRDDVNAYCGLLASIYSRANLEAEPVAGQDGSRGLDAEEAERRRWLRRATEVPLRVAELSMGTAIACLPYKKQVRKSLHSDWVAGGKLLRTAMEISLRNVSINIKDMQRGGNDLDVRLARVRDTEPPWEDLCDIY